MGHAMHSNEFRMAEIFSCPHPFHCDFHFFFFFFMFWRWVLCAACERSAKITMHFFAMANYIIKVLFTTHKDYRIRENVTLCAHILWRDICTRRERIGGSSILIIHARRMCVKWLRLAILSSSRGILPIIYQRNIVVRSSFGHTTHTPSHWKFQ